MNMSRVKCQMGVFDRSSKQSQAMLCYHFSSRDIDDPFTPSKFPYNYPTKFNIFLETWWLENKPFLLGLVRTFRRRLLLNFDGEVKKHHPQAL